MGPTGRHPTQAGSRQAAAVTAAWARHGVARVTRCARTRRAVTASGGGAWRRGETGPERTKGGAHGEEEEAASLTGGDAGEERRRGGVPAEGSGGGRRRSSGAL